MGINLPKRPCGTKQKIYTMVRCNKKQQTLNEAQKNCWLPVLKISWVRLLHSGLTKQNTTKQNFVPFLFRDWLTASKLTMSPFWYTSKGFKSVDSKSSQENAWAQWDTGRSRHTFKFCILGSVEICFILSQALKWHQGDARSEYYQLTT